MRIYVASLTDYNAGDLEGTWIDLEDMSDGEDVMTTISEFLEDLTKRKKRTDWFVKNGPSMILKGLDHSIRKTVEDYLICW